MVTIRVLIAEPGYSPYVAFFRDVEEADRQILTGNPEILYPFSNRMIALVRGDTADQPLNRTLENRGVVSGCFYICGAEDGVLKELTREQAERYEKRYLYPEEFQETEDGLMATPKMPKIKPKDERLGQKKGWLKDR